MATPGFARLTLGVSLASDGSVERRSTLSRAGRLT
jgi:hypothetical protein